MSKATDYCQSCAGLERRIATLESALASERAARGECEKTLIGASHALRSYQYGNCSPDLAADMADAIDKRIASADVTEGGGAHE